MLLCVDIRYDFTTERTSSTYDFFFFFLNWNLFSSENGCIVFDVGTGPHRYCRVTVGYAFQRGNTCNAYHLLLNISTARHLL